MTTLEKVTKIYMTYGYESAVQKMNTEEEKEIFRQLCIANDEFEEDESDDYCELYSYACGYTN